MSDRIEELISSAYLARRDRRLADAKRDLTAAVRLAREAGVPTDLARALTRLGAIERDLHNVEPALGHYEEAVALYRTEGDALGLAHTVRHLGDIQQDRGRVDLAESFYNESLAIYRGQSGAPPLDLANAIRGLALLKDTLGQTESARALWQEARGLYAAVGVPEGVAECARRLGRA